MGANANQSATPAQATLFALAYLLGRNHSRCEGNRAADRRSWAEPLGPSGRHGYPVGVPPRPARQ
jgi:hypothetical protein